MKNSVKIPAVIFPPVAYICIMYFLPPEQKNAAACVLLAIGIVCCALPAGKGVLCKSGLFRLADAALLLLLALCFTLCMHAAQEKAEMVSAWTVFASAAAVPFVEELLFRGILLGKGKELLGRLPLLILSALLFALAHSGIYAVLTAFAFGAASGLMLLRTGSLIPSIALHMCVNLLSYLPFTPPPALTASAWAAAGVIIILLTGDEMKK